jgi:fructose-1,6-bisphosphatase I
MPAMSLAAFLDDRSAEPVARDVAATVSAIAAAAVEVWQAAHEGSATPQAIETGVNPDGDRQVALDVIADHIFLGAARKAPVAAYASEELAEPVLIDRGRPLALAVDPLDGSSNVDLNLSYGTIFSILPMLGPNGRGPIASFLQPGNHQLAAGLFIYGPKLAFVLTLGEGTHVFIHGQEGFSLNMESVRVPRRAAEFAINASNYRHWDESVRLYFDDCIKGVHGPREQDFNMRWLASLVVETYRILRRGGVFLYPADRREGYGNGRLRLVYEANPVAFVIEQAGGSATSGVEPILSLTPTGLHQRTPLIFGSGREVAKLTRYHTDPSSIAERAPLFGNRGLFRL